MVWCCVFGVCVACLVFVFMVFAGLCMVLAGFMLFVNELARGFRVLGFGVACLVFGAHACLVFGVCV
jgi:hypothetical protein